MKIKRNRRKLSKRLLMTVNLCPKVKTMGDIGCDHGYLGIHLIEAGFAERVIASDVNPLPLQSAKANISSSGMLERITLRLSDGLSAFYEGELDCAVFAGMGGRLMARILGEGFARKALPPVFICQPQSELPFFRKFLYENGFIIEDEDMVIEDEKYYLAMRVIFSHDIKNHKLSETELYYGNILTNRKHPVFLSYLKKELNRIEDIIKTLDIKSIKAQNTKAALENERNLILSALEAMEV